MPRIIDPQDDSNEGGLLRELLSSVRELKTLNDITSLMKELKSTSQQSPSQQSPTAEPAAEYHQAMKEVIEKMTTALQEMKPPVVTVTVPPRSKTEKYVFDIRRDSEGKIAKVYVSEEKS